MSLVKPSVTDIRDSSTTVVRDERTIGQLVADINTDPHHPTRRALDAMLVRLAEDLQHDPETQQRAEAL